MPPCTTVPPMKRTERTPETVRFPLRQSLPHELAIDEGSHPTLVPGVKSTRRSRPQGCHPAIYEPTIIFIGKGASASM